MKLRDLDARTLAALPDDTLGMLVLDAFGGGWNVHSFFAGLNQTWPIFNQPGVSERVADAWAWLESRGFVGYHPEQGSSANARRMTAAGKSALYEGLTQLRASERLDVDLHPEIAVVARQQFLIGEYELAAFASLKAVEVRVRKLGAFGHDQIGVALMAAAFSPKSGALTDRETEPGEQEAMMALFRGAIGTFKNPSSHRPVDYDDPTLASEVVLLADLLMRLLDRVDKRLQAPNPG